MDSRGVEVTEIETATAEVQTATNRKSEEARSLRRWCNKQEPAEIGSLRADLFLLKDAGTRVAQSLRDAKGSA